MLAFHFYMCSALGPIPARRRLIGLPPLQRTLVPLQPSLKAASWAKSSPNPSITPLTKGNSRFMAALRRSDQTVGGW